LLLLGRSDPPRYALVRVLETLLGAAIGVAVNVVIAPPVHTRSAAGALRGAADSVGELLGDTVDALGGRWPPEHRDWWVVRGPNLPHIWPPPAKLVPRPGKAAASTHAAPCGVAARATLSGSWTSLSTAWTEADCRRELDRMAREVTSSPGLDPGDVVVQTSLVGQLDRFLAQLMT